MKIPAPTTFLRWKLILPLLFYHKILQTFSWKNQWQYLLNRKDYQLSTKKKKKKKKEKVNLRCKSNLPVIKGKKRKGKNISLKNCLTAAIISLRRPSIVVNFPPSVPIWVSKSSSGIDTLLVSLLKKKKKKKKY